MRSRTKYPVGAAWLAFGLLALALAACGDDSGSNATPTSPGDGGASAKALLVIGSSADANKVLKAAVGLDKVDMYLLTSLSQDPAALDGITFAGTDVVWGAQLLGPQESAAATFNAAYTAQYNEEPTGVAWHAYDSIYTVALAAVAANSRAGDAIKGHLFYVANSPGGPATYGSEGFAAAVEALSSAEGDVNYIGASGQVDFDASGAISKATAQTWKVLNGQIAPIETRDIDLAVEAGVDVPVGSRTPATDAPTEPLVVGLLLDTDDISVTNAAQMAVDEINAAGGVFGQDVVLESQTIAVGDEAASAVDALVEAGAGAIVGPVEAASVSTALDAAKTANVPILALSNAPELSSVEGEGALFRVVPSLELQLPVLANLALESEANIFCVLYAQGPQGESMAAAFQRAAEHKETTVRSSQAFDPASGELPSLLNACLG